MRKRGRRRRTRRKTMAGSAYQKVKREEKVEEGRQKKEPEE